MSINLITELVVLLLVFGVFVAGVVLIVVGLEEPAESEEDDND